MTMLPPMPCIDRTPHVEDDFNRMYDCADECAPGSRFEVADCVTVHEAGDIFTQCSAIFVDGATGQTTDIGITNTWDIKVCASQCGNIEVRGLPETKHSKSTVFDGVETSCA